MEKNNAIAEVFGRINEKTLLQVILVLAVAWLLIRLTERFFPWLAERLGVKWRFTILSLLPVIRLMAILGAIGLLIPILIAPTFENLVAILGAAGLALGFAFKDYVSSLIAGIVTLYEKPYCPGDWVEISGTYGEIRSIGMRALKLVTPDDTVVTIPHMKIWDASVFNANDGQRELQVAADFYLHPDHDGREVQRRLQDVAYTSPFLHQGRPVAVVASEKPWGTHYRLKAYPMDGRDQFQFATDMTVRGKAVLRRMGVRFAEACTFKTSE